LADVLATEKAAFFSAYDPGAFKSDEKAPGYF